MKAREDHAPSSLIASISAFLLVTPGCTGPAPWWVTDLRITSSDNVVLDGYVPGDSPPTLVIEATHESGEEQSIQAPLSYENNAGLTLEGSTSMLWERGGDYGYEPEDFHLRFDLVGMEPEDTADPGYQTVEVEGAREQATLWEGWRLDLQWSGPSDWIQ